MKLAHMLAILPVALTPANAFAQSVHLSRMTEGYSYFNRPAANWAAHDADARQCASIANQMQSEEEQRQDRERNGRGIGLLQLWIITASHKGIVAAALENCMVVRGWRVVSVDDETGRKWSAPPAGELRQMLSHHIGAVQPMGRVLRWWNNDAARASSSRFELRPPAGGTPLSLRAVPDDKASNALATPPNSLAANVEQSWKELTRTVDSKAWDTLPADRALVIVQMKGVGPKNGVTLSFQRVDKPKTVFVAFQHGLSGNRKDGRFYAFSVQPGLWRLAGIHALNLCLGSPAFEVKAGEVVYAGSFDLSAEGIGPDLSLDGPRAYLAGHAVASRLRPAAYRNGIVDRCQGVGSIYALEVPGAPFEPGYQGGSRAQP